MVNAFMAGSGILPPAVSQALANWTAISQQLLDLFARAPREALVDPQALLAQLALEAIEGGGFPRDLAAEIRNRANEIIAECAARDGKKIEQALLEPKELLGKLDRLIVSLHEEKGPMDKWAAMGLAGNLLDVCQRFDKSFSAIPSRLRSS